jgi:ketosteroid isomerase-like protein
VTGRLYDALADADMATFVALLDPAVSWTVPGRHSLAGTWRGLEAVLAHLAEVAQRTGGRIRLDLVDVLAGDVHAAAVVDVEISIDGRTATDRQVHVIEVRAGRVVSLREYHGDEAAMALLVDGAPPPTA